MAAAAATTLSHASSAQQRRRFEGKTIVITGGGGTFGRVGAKYFAEQGAMVVLVDVNQAAEEAVAPRDNTQDLLRGAVAVGLLGFGTVAWVQEFLSTQAPGLAVSALCLLGGWAALVSRVTGGVPDDFYDNSQS